MSKVGIITYHAAYNYGSVLQAKATQEVVQKLGHEAQIIDYRPKLKLITIESSTERLLVSSRSSKI